MGRKQGVVLERTFATAIADRAIERMVDEKEFENAPAVGVDGFGVGVDGHTVAGGEGAGGLRLGHFLYLPVLAFEADFDEAHAAHANRLHARVVTEDGDFEAEALDGFDYKFALGDFEFDVV